MEGMKEERTNRDSVRVHSLKDVKMTMQTDLQIQCTLPESSCLCCENW